MTFLNMDAMSVASNCSIIYYTPKGVFFLFKLEGCALKVGGVTPPPLGGSRNISADSYSLLKLQPDKVIRPTPSPRNEKSIFEKNNVVLHENNTIV